VSDMGMEKPADDAFEQDRDVVETGEETGAPRGDVPFDVDEADAAEQERAIEIDEDDYRLALGDAGGPGAVLARETAPGPPGSRCGSRRCSGPLARPGGPGLPTG
jgi:hypothetical protein